VGDLMGQDAGDLIARHAAQQPLGQYDRGAFRTAVCTENLNTGVVVMKSAQDGV
jgi:hypothetical protein